LTTRTLKQSCKDFFGIPGEPAATRYSGSPFFFVYMFSLLRWSCAITHPVRTGTVLSCVMSCANEELVSESEVIAGGTPWA